MKRIILFIVVFIPAVSLLAIDPPSLVNPNGRTLGCQLPQRVWSSFYSRGWGLGFRVNLYGCVRIVEEKADFHVRIVDSGADLKVQMVDYTPKSCGEWRLVKSAPANFTIQIVDEDEDFTIEVTSPNEKNWVSPKIAGCRYKSRNTGKDIPLHGCVQVVEDSADFQVYINEDPRHDGIYNTGVVKRDLPVEIVDRAPFRCGEWQFVESMPDFTVKFVRLQCADFYILFLNQCD